MKTVKMKLGTGYVDVSVPEENLLGMLVKEVPPSSMTEDEVILDALAHPIGTPRLRELVKPGNTVCIVISDVTRAWQRMSVYLPHIVKELNDAGIEDKDIRFLSALGYHRKHTPEEHAKLLGPELLRRFQIIDHDCLDKDNLVHVGTTSRGTPVIINQGCGRGGSPGADRLLHLPPVGGLGRRQKIDPARHLLDRVHPEESFNDHGRAGQTAP